MKISSAIGLGIGLAALAGVGVTGYVLLSKQGQAQRQPGVYTDYRPPVADHGSSAVPSQTEPKKSPQAEAKEWLGVAEDGWDLTKDIVSDIKSWT